MIPRVAPALRFDFEEAYAASDDWRFNCGPAALCAVADKTPSEIRPFLFDFEEKGYTNPTLMFGALRKLKIDYRVSARSDVMVTDREGMMPKYGLVRIQWGGSWTDQGVPMAARYRKTHWIATELVGGERAVFDINAIEHGGWITYHHWAAIIVPQILKACVPRHNGLWWPTHCLTLHA